MEQPVVVSACRTAIGTSYKGTLTETTAFDLAEVVIAESVRRSGLDPGDLDDVVMGEVLYGGGDVARHAALTAGLGHLPGAAVNRHCASGLAAVQFAAANVAAGMSDAAIAGGANSQSTSPACRFREVGTEDWSERWISPTHPDRPDAPNMDMSITVGWNTAQRAGVTREEMDAWAHRSHERAVASIDAGDFVEEIVAMEVTTRGGETIDWRVDEHPRRGSTLEKLASLPPLHPEIEGFSITAGNASGLNDGAAAICVASAELAERRGIEPLGTVRSWATVGVDPAETGLAPTLAIPRALDRIGLGVADVELFEVNEAFAAMCVATARILGLDEARVNVNGSGCSLGHPVAATGARMVVTMLHELARRGGGIGVVSMCAGGGMGSALVLEVPTP